MNDVDSREPDTVQTYLNAKLKGVFREVFLKWELNSLSLTESEIESIAKARIQLRTRSFQRTPITVGLWLADSDDWSQETITYNDNRPGKGALLGTRRFTVDSNAETFEFDVTPFIKEALLGDQSISFITDRQDGDGFLSFYRTLASGYGPELIIELEEDPVPDAPTPPHRVPHGNRGGQYYAGLGG